MPTINYRIEKIEGKSTGEEAERVDVKSNFAILSIKKDNSPVVGDFIRVNFRFEIGYKPDLGSMKIEGNVWYRGDNLDKLVTEKKGKIRLDPEVVKEVTTSIVRDSLLEMVDLSKKLRLPAPVRLPNVDVRSTEFEFTKAS